MRLMFASRNGKFYGLPIGSGNMSFLYVHVYSFFFGSPISREDFSGAV